MKGEQQIENQNLTKTINNMKKKFTNSSQVNEIEYNENTKVLTVVFKSGTYDYIKNIEARAVSHEGKYLKPQFKRLLVEKVELSELTKIKSDLILATPALSKFDKEKKDAPVEFSLVRIAEFSDDCREQFKIKGQLCVIIKMLQTRIPIVDPTKEYYLIYEHEIEAIVYDKTDEPVNN